MILARLVQAVFSLLFPGAPVWVADLVAVLLPRVIGWVKEMEGSDLEGAARFEYVLAQSQGLIDDAFDGVPGWSEVPEEERDRMVTGLIEFILGAQRLLSTTKDRKAFRKALRKLRV